MSKEKAYQIRRSGEYGKSRFTSSIKERVIKTKTRIEK
jgi:hypothetical protein